MLINHHANNPHCRCSNASAPAAALRKMGQYQTDLHMGQKQTHGFSRPQGQATTVEIRWWPHSWVVEAAACSILWVALVVMA